MFKNCQNSLALLSNVEAIDKDHKKTKQKSPITNIDCSETLLLFFLPFPKSLMNDKHENENRKNQVSVSICSFFISFKPASSLITRAFPELWWTFKTFISKLHNLFPSQSIFNLIAPRWAQQSLLSCAKRKLPK